MRCWHASRRRKCVPRDVEGRVRILRLAARPSCRVCDSIELVYGGGHVGLMGALADEALAHGGRVIGVIPEHLMRPEVAHQGLTELIIVDSMHTRKQTMAMRSDAFVVLPGGFGTFEEMFEMLTWLQLRVQVKPVGLVNVEGYFDSLLEFLAHAGREGLIRREHQDLLLVENTPARLFARLNTHVANAGVTPAAGDLSLG
jgi:uncharacterized protein (TIGR00730 family)